MLKKISSKIFREILLMPLPDFDVETGLIKKGYKAIAGVDEVGRGCLAGPVTAAAVILKNSISELKDSKQISSSKRESLSKIIAGLALATSKFLFFN